MLTGPIVSLATPIVSLATVVDQPASPEIELADRLSYLELDERVNRPARFFRDSGLRDRYRAQSTREERE